MSGKTLGQLIDDVLNLVLHMVTLLVKYAYQVNAFLFFFYFISNFIVLKSPHRSF